MEQGHFCTGKETVPGWWEPPGEKGNGGEEVTRLSPAGGLSGGEHLHTPPHTAGLGRGCGTTPCRAEQGWVSGVSHFWRAEPHVEV